MLFGVPGALLLTLTGVIRLFSVMFQSIRLDGNLHLGPVIVAETELLQFGLIDLLQGPSWASRRSAERAANSLLQI